ncbi:MAG: helix-hairpin-helix domain-containing protein [Tsuneonella suprasediminis]|uniref:Helix-hairpin-helix domain-containing protein n=1 Tax=Tsuneonella suprasediminis TaxID=2306996 RepID=A0A419R219_9SPHN|nr:helix-hairpin-helix domain-containing protein [Tsuneonella suprasediminis]RJX67783.1 helix-hairpin-helix domain-containing protein [Tsuneonella suprasediminis]UBS33269.1 helix-hairpin-helix domain-containing protein [Altererythrobacter sp. N1]
MVRQFSADERAALLAIRGVGPTVIQRLEEIDVASFDDLANTSVETVCNRVAAALGTSCWKNSPQAKGAIAAAIDYARTQTGAMSQ